MNETNTNNINPENQTPVEQPLTGQMPLEDPTFWMKVKAFYKDNKWPIWIIVLCLLAMGGFLFFTFHKSGPGAGNPKVELSIDAPAQSASGSEVVYKINFANRDSQTIKDAVIDVTYPAGFTYKDSAPASKKLNGSEFEVPSLDPSQDGTIMIKGILIGNPDEVKSISAVMHFSFSTFNSDFVVQAQNQTKIVNSDVSLQFDGPFKATNDQSLTYNLTYKNSTFKDINNLKLSIDLPQEFKVDEYKPAPDSGNVWRITTLHSGESETISITGSFQGAKPGQQEVFSSHIEGISDTGDSYNVATSEYNVSITGTPISLDLKMDNQGSSSNQIVNPGDQLVYTVHYQNNSDSTQSGINISASVNGDAYDLRTLRSDDATIQGNTLTWNGAQVDALNNLQVNQSGDLTFTVAVKNPATQSNATNMTVKAQAKVVSNSFSQGFSSNEISSKVATVPGITSSVSYASGSSPLLPSLKTTFNVTLNLTNTTNELNSGVVSFNLPNTTDFNKGTINSEEQNNVTYDKNTRKLIWNVGKIPAHSGASGSGRKLVFQVSIIPALSNVGNDVTLVNNIKLSGTDSFTNQQVTISHDNITTNDDKAGNRTVQSN